MTSVAKLQKDYDILYKKYTRQQDLLLERKMKHDNLKDQYDRLEKTI